MTKSKAKDAQNGKDKAVARDPRSPQLQLQYGQTGSQALAEAVANGTLMSATTQVYANTNPLMDVMDLVASMKKAGDEVVGGDFARVERILTYQLLTLNEMFSNLAQRASLQDSFKGIETLTRLAFKAQAQARATAETLSVMKNPQPYIKQANIAHGHQQVNNGVPARVPAAPRAGKIESAPNKLLEKAKHDNILDTGASQTTGATDSTMAALGAKHGTPKRRGQGRRSP